MAPAWPHLAGNRVATDKQCADDDDDDDGWRFLRFIPRLTLIDSDYFIELGVSSFIPRWSHLVRFRCRLYLPCQLRTSSRRRFCPACR
jgi:hypothetical protein